MRSTLTLAERDRRWAALSEAMAKEGYDALVVVSNDYNGHRGGLRYLTDIHQAAFYSYVVLPRDGAAIPVLPMAMVGYKRSEWIEDYHFTQDMKSGLVEVLRGLDANARVGVVGMSQIMRVEDYLHLKESLPGSEIAEASVLFEEVRSRKSAEEIEGLEEASYIADECLGRMLEIVRPGLSTREVCAEMFKHNAKLGGKDPIFLTMDGVVIDGKSEVRWAQAADTVISPTDLFQFSFEMIGPSGYWVELCRMVTFAPLTERERDIHAAVAAGLEVARRGLKAGARAEDVETEMLDAFAAEDSRCAYWIGHGIGQDVIEAPWLGRKVILAEDESRATTFEIGEDMAFAVHPFLLSLSRPGVAGYMADTMIAGADGARALSRYPLDVIDAS